MNTQEFKPNGEIDLDDWTMRRLDKAMRETSMDWCFTKPNVPHTVVYIYNCIHEVIVEIWDDEHHTKLGDEFHYAHEEKFDSLEEARVFYDAQIEKHKDNKLFKWITLKKYFDEDEDGDIIDEYNPPEQDSDSDSDSDEETAWCFRCNTTFPIDRDGGDWGVHEEWVCDRCLPTCLKCGKQLWQASDECCGEGRTDGICEQTK